jgi:hypothetical protein
MQRLTIYAVDGKVNGTTVHTRIAARNFEEAVSLAENALRAEWESYRSTRIAQWARITGVYPTGGTVYVDEQTH